MKFGWGRPVRRLTQPSRRSLRIAALTGDAPDSGAREHSTADLKCHPRPGIGCLQSSGMALALSPGGLMPSPVHKTSPQDPADAPGRHARQRSSLLRLCARVAVAAALLAFVPV